MRKRSHRVQVMCIAMGLALVAAACGDDDGGPEVSSPSSDATSSSTTAASSSTTAASGGGDQGGSSGAGAGGGDNSVSFSTDYPKADVDRSGETIKVGFVNNEGGTYSLPEYRVGAELAVEHINATGGVNGAKIDLQVCSDDASPEGSVNCANRFVEDGVPVVTMGFDAAFEAAQPVLEDARIPFIGTALLGPNQRTSETAFGLGTASGSYFTSPLYALKELGAKKVYFLSEDTPSSHDSAELIQRTSRGVGIEVESAFVDPSAPDYAPLIQVASASGADAIWAFVSEPHCVQFVQAARNAGYEGELLAGVCSTFIESVGDAAVGTLTFADHYTPDVASSAPPRIQENLAEYEKVMKDAGQEELLNTGAGTVFGMMMNVRRILESIPEGPISAETVLTAASQVRNMPSWDSPDVDCADHPWPSEPSSCRNGLLMLRTVERDGKIVREALNAENNGFRSDPDPEA